MKPEDARIKIGYMPQHTQFDSSFPVSVMDVVLMGRINSTSFGRYTREAREAAMEAMKEMGMYDLRNRSFARLSGGQRQRVLIARALACAPQLLLLDEPTANVDPGIQEDFYGKIEELSERMSILIVSHDLGVVSKKIKSVICVNRRVHIHPTSELNGEIIQEIYGHGIDLVRHDYRCSGEGHVDE
jgi:zinc transport system ATP-binding protein